MAGVNLKAQLLLALITVCSFAGSANAGDLNGRYLLDNAACIPKYPDMVKPTVLTIDADSLRLSMSVKVRSPEFADVGVFDMPVGTIELGSGTSGAGLTYLHQSASYSKKGTGFGYSKSDNTGVVEKTSIALTSNGRIFIRRLLDNGFHGVCTGRKI